MKQLFTLQNISSKYDELIEGYEEDDEQNEILMREVYNDFGLKESKLKKLLTCDLALKDKDILKLWDGIVKWCVSDIEKIKSWLVTYIYEKRKNKLRKRADKVVSFNGLLKGTCINEKNEKYKCEVCCYAALKGHLECLKYLHEQGCKWDEWTCIYAGYNGHLACLQYAHENGCEWDILTCVYAASNDHLKCLKYAYENKCPGYEEYDEYIEKQQVNKLCKK